MKRRGFLQAIFGAAAVPAAMKAAEAFPDLPAHDPRTDHPDYFEQYERTADGGMGPLQARGIVDQWVTVCAPVSTRLHKCMFNLYGDPDSDL